MASKSKPTEYFHASPKRVYLLTLVTFGWYALFWMYRNWKAIRDAKKVYISPFWRSIFSLFFIETLFKYIRDDSKKANYPKRYSSGWMAARYIFAAIISSVVSAIASFTMMPKAVGNTIVTPSGHTLLFYSLTAAAIAFVALSMSAFYVSQKAINHYLQTLAPDTLPQKRTSGEVVMIVIGLALTALNISGAFFSDYPTLYQPASNGTTAVINQPTQDMSPAGQTPTELPPDINDMVGSYRYWSTYTNKQYGFSIKYPSLTDSDHNWKYYEQPTSNSSGTPPQKLAVQFVESSGQRYPASVLVEVYDTNLAKSIAFYDSFLASMPDLAVTKDTATLNGVQATSFSYSGNGVREMLYLVPRGDKTIAIRSVSNQVSGLDKQGDYGNLFDLMSASFAVK